MTDDEISRAEAWLESRAVFLVSDAEDQAPTLDWILERARLSVLRYGITDLLIDPWNEIEHSRGDLSETEYIGRALQRMKAFGFRHGCNVWIIAHPKIQRAEKVGGEIPPPGLYEISGSANWANKADFAITVHTPKDLTQIHLTKARFRRWGRKGEMRNLRFSVSTGRYEAC